MRQDTIGSRLSAARRTIGKSIDDFSESTGIPVSTLKKYESGYRIPGGEALQQMSKVGINLHWLLTGRGPMLSSSESDDLEFVLVPQYDVDASAGGGAVVQCESEVGRLAFRREWINQKSLSAKDLLIVRIKGDSMSPTIRSGSLALVDTRQEHFSEDGIYIIMVEGHLVAKRLQPDFKGGVYIRSDNPAYKDEHLTQDQAANLYIIGRVVWVGGEI